MINLTDRNVCPSLEEIGEYIGNPVFLQFCAQIKTAYQCKEKIEFSACSWEPGWNVKFRKSGKTLCAIYPRESFFRIMVVIGQKEKEAISALLADCSRRLKDIYRETPEGNGQRWLMIDREDPDVLYNDMLRLIHIRSGKDLSKQKTNH